jgi:hypothetical protein
MRQGILIILVFVFILSSCRKEKTSWSTNWAVPLVNDTLDLADQINDSTLSVNSTGFLEVDLTRTVLDLGIEDLLELPDTTISQTFNSALPFLNVPAGFTIVNQIEEHTLDLKDIQLKKIRLTKGEIQFVVFNPVPTRSYFTVKLPGVSRDNVLLEQQFSDLSGYEIDLTGMTGSSFNILQSLLLVTSDPDGSDITVTSSQQFKIEATFRNVRLDYARGYFGNRIITDTTEVDLEPLQALIGGGIDLPAPNLEIDLINGVKVGAKATLLTLTNTSTLGQTVALTGNHLGVPFYLDEPTGSWGTLQPTTKTLQFNGANSSIESYLENLGAKHKLGYKLELNPWGNVSGGYNEVFPNSRLKVKVRAQMPLAVGADGLTLQDTFDIDLSQSVDKTHIGSGSFILNASNTFPISASINLFLLDANGYLLHTISASEQIGSGTLGTYDAISELYKKNSEVIYNLSASVLNEINQIKKVVVRAVFDTPDNSGTNVQAAIEAGSFLSVKLRTRFILNTVY